jgi:hypothetical protein
MFQHASKIFGQTAYLTKLVKNMIKKTKVWLKGKEKKIIMLYLVTTKLKYLSGRCPRKKP